ncbi:ribbon-helix-helix protein, CopG family [Ferrovum sp.]
MKRTHFFLPHQLFTELKELSEMKGLSVSELIRRAVEDWLNRQK